MVGGVVGGGSSSVLSVLLSSILCDDHTLEPIVVRPPLPQDFKMASVWRIVAILSILLKCRGAFGQSAGNANALFGQSIYTSNVVNRGAGGVVAGGLNTPSWFVLCLLLLLLFFVNRMY